MSAMKWISAVLRSSVFTVATISVAGLLVLSCGDDKEEDDASSGGKDAVPATEAECKNNNEYEWKKDANDNNKEKCMKKAAS